MEPYLKTNVTPLESNKVELTVEIPAQDVRKAIDDQFKELANTVKVPGFRQGKVPREVLERRIGTDAIIHEVIQDLVPKVYPMAVDEAGVRPIDLPDVKVDEYDGKGPLVFHATVEIEPEATISGYEAIEITVPPSVATDEEVDAQVDLLRDRFAKLEVVEGRPLTLGDFALIDFTGYLDDLQFEGGSGSDYLLEVGSGRFLPGFETGLVGAEKGEQKDIWIDVPDDYHGQAIAGKRVRFEVTVKEIKKKERPEPDDAFASEASEYDTLEELKKSIKDQVEESKRRAVAVSGQTQILDWVEQHVEVEVPQKMIEMKFEDLVREFMQMIQSQGLTVEQYFELSESSEEILKASLQSEAGRRVREEFALDAIARSEGIIASDPEIQDEIDAMAKRIQQDPSEVRRRLEERGSMSEFRATLVRRKALEWLNAHAVVTIKEDAPLEPVTVSRDAPAAPAGTLEVQESVPKADTVTQEDASAPEAGAAKEE